METDRRPARPILLLLVLTAWVLGLFYLPPRLWVTAWPRGPSVALGEALEVPAGGDKPGRVPLPGIRQGEGESILVTLTVPAGPGFSLQMRDPTAGGQVETFRFPVRARLRTFSAVLGAPSTPRELRLALWNRARSPVVVERIEKTVLRPGYRLPRQLYLALGPAVLVLAGFRDRRSLSRYFRPEARPISGKESPRWDGTVAFVLLLLSFAVFRAAPVHQLLDAKFLTVVSHSFLRTGTVAVPMDFERSRRAAQIYTLRPVGDKVYHYFASAPAVLNAPFVLAFELAGVTPVDDEGRYLGQNEQRILRFVAALLAAALCAVLFLVARIWLPPGWALGLTLSFAFGTQILSSVSRPFWSHAWSTLLLSAALLLLAAPRFRTSPWWSAAMSTLLCWAYFCRPPMSLAIVGVTAYLFLTRRRVLWPFMATGVGWAFLFVVYARSTFGTWVPPYFLSSHLESGRLAGGLLLSSYPSAVVGTLFSPGRGLFIYVPLSLLTLYLVTRWWRWLPEKGLAVTALGVWLAQWQLVSLFRNWWGGQSFGPRLMSDVVPWIFLLAALALAGLRQAKIAGAYRWTAYRWATIGFVVAASIFVNVRGAWVQETQRGAGIWNWRYPQFLAGMLERPDSEPARRQP